MIKKMSAAKEEPQMPEHELVALVNAILDAEESAPISVEAFRNISLDEMSRLSRKFLELSREYRDRVRMLNMNQLFLDPKHFPNHRNFLVKQDEAEHLNTKKLFALMRALDASSKFIPYLERLYLSRRIQELVMEKL